MTDLHKILYDLLQERRGQPTEQRIVDKRVDNNTFEVTLDYRDQSITNYVVLAQENVIIIRYEDEDNNLHQDAMQTNTGLRTTTLKHKVDNGYLTISIEHSGSDKGGIIQ